MDAQPSWVAARQPGAVVPVVTTDRAAAWQFTTFVAAGQHPGPVLAVLAGVHGDEYEGPVALGQLLGALDLSQLRGTLLAVPVANPPAFAAGTRHSPLDQGNLARLFPGSPTGTASERLAAALTTEVIGTADALIDLHSAGIAYAMPTLVGYYQAPDRVGERSAALARAFGAPVLWHHPTLGPGRTLTAAYEQRIPAIYTEAPGGGGAPDRVVQLFVAGIRRVLSALEMLPAVATPPPPAEEWCGAGDTDQALAAGTTGLFLPAVAVGQAVTAGQFLGAIMGLDGQTLEQFQAEQSGIVAMVRRLPPVAVGTGLFLLTQPMRPA